MPPRRMPYLHLLFVILTPLLLLACGEPVTITTRLPDMPTALAQTTSTPPTALAQTPPVAPITVSMTNAPDENNAEEQARFQQLVATFKQQHPEVTIAAHQGGWDKAAFAAKLAAGTMEDSYLVPVTEPQDLIARGYAADITAILQRWEHFASFNPAVLQGVQDAQGHIYGIPVSGFA